MTTAVTETATSTVTVAEPSVGLPQPVAEARDALLAAARTGDYEELRPLVGDKLAYSFGGSFEGGPIAYWQRVEATTDESPIRILTELLELPYTLYRGTYVWPFAFDKEPGDLTEYERGLLGERADDFGTGIGYLGWRVGIEPDGDWIFFIAGD